MQEQIFGRTNLASQAGNGFITSKRGFPFTECAAAYLGQELHSSTVDHLLLRCRVQSMHAGLQRPFLRLWGLSDTAWL